MAIAPIVWSTCGHSPGSCGGAQVGRAGFVSTSAATASAVRHAIEQPPEVAVNEIIVRPTAQQF